MSLHPILARTLVCPQDHGDLLQVHTAAGAGLYNPRLRRLYSIDEHGIPNLLIDDARSVPNDEHAELMTVAQPLV